MPPEGGYIIKATPNCKMIASWRDLLTLDLQCSAHDGGRKNSAESGSFSVKILTWTLASLTGVAFLAINCAASAQSVDDVPKIDSLTPLSEYLSRPDDSKVNSYPFIRCAGLFLGFNYYAGANLKPETSADLANNIKALRNTAILSNAQNMAKQRGQTLGDMSEEDIEAIGRETWVVINSIAFFYDDRFKMNFASSGAAFGEDAMVGEDFEICGEFSQAAIDYMQ
ncbi:hypothetical protein SAMN04488523_11859 [Sulfitobacter brevis]|uniref:Uncharacterized protein n=2 Tax=Sulfitobacter brevis TaxID=74348 RepID=A0A1I2G0W8_9RHOB|nr:hypothetical protein SAMN04488523_11859 [Sulfitobacter brevis]